MLSLLFGRVFNRLIDAQPPLLLPLHLPPFSSKYKGLGKCFFLFWYRKPLLGAGTVQLSQSVDCGTVTS